MSLTNFLILKDFNVIKSVYVYSEEPQNRHGDSQLLKYIKV